MTKARVPWSAIHIEINFLSKCPRIFLMNHQDRNPSAKRPQHHQHLSLRPKKRWHRKPRLHTIWLGWWPLSHCAVPKGAFFQASIHISWCGRPTWLARSCQVREEFAVLKQLDHPHVLRIFEARSCSGHSNVKLLGNAVRSTISYGTDLPHSLNPAKNRHATVA